MAVVVRRFEAASPADTTGLRAALNGLDRAKIRRVAIIAKTEGPATVNDFSRVLALQNFRLCLAEYGLDDEARSQIIISMGCEGLISPGGYLIVDYEGEHEEGLAGLRFGMARSRPVTAAEMITSKHSLLASGTVSEAIQSAGLTPESVELVLMKTPILTMEEAVNLTAEKQKQAGQSGLARGTAALGIALALQELQPEQINDGAIIGQPDLHATRSMVFSGNETRCCEVIVLGNADPQRKVIRTGIIHDLVDIDSMAAIITGGPAIDLAAVRGKCAHGALQAAFFKAGVAPNGRVRGHRTTVFASDLDPDKHMRAAASGVIGALLGDTRVFVSGGAEHQAPPGGGIFSVILRG